ncbi:hypothetical protein [Bradyrhizobium sp.]|uniref:hypothetical protein n=1 Tax=Bradyrhizobium sp. TaxID=376 RepID=UPI0023917DED|nr:hypothetical protein [Bradyrhizobium sp.]MDE2379159.1 hypothetical protein [Bradyrhizobium sp.]
MAKDFDPLAGAFETKESGGLLSGLLAEENEFDRRTMWRLGAWGATAVGALVVAVLANQAQLGWRRDQVAAADLARQNEQLQVLTRESQNEARRLASAIETLNSDRDRLYARVTVLEQGLDSVTGAIARQAASPPQPSPAKPAMAEPSATAAPAPQSNPPSVAPVASTQPTTGDKPPAEAARDKKDKDAPGQPPQAAASTPAAAATPVALPAVPLVASKSIMAPPDPAAAKLIEPETSAKPAADSVSPPTEVATAAPATQPETAEGETPAPAITVQQTRFAVDLGGASSIGGLRALWRGLIKASPELAALRPIIMIKENNTGAGMQLRLGAGPLVNAAAAAKICAALAENDRTCETAVFDGQHLSMKQAAPKAETPAAAAKPDKPQHRRGHSRRTSRDEPAQQPAPAKPETSSSTLSSFFSRR